MRPTRSKESRMNKHIKHLLLAALASLSLSAHAAVNVLGGDKVKVSSATNALQDPHRVEARPSLIARTRNANLLVCTGLELEVGWLPILLQQSGNPKIARAAGLSG